MALITHDDVGDRSAWRVVPILHKADGKVAQLDPTASDAAFGIVAFRAHVTPGSLARRIGNPLEGDEK